MAQAEALMRAIAGLARSKTRRVIFVPTRDGELRFAWNPEKRMLEVEVWCDGSVIVAHFRVKVRRMSYDRSPSGLEYVHIRAPYGRLGLLRVGNTLSLHFGNFTRSTDYAPINAVSLLVRLR